MSSSGDRNGAGDVGEMSEKADTSGRVVPAAASATDRANRPRLRLGDAEQIAQQRMAFGGGASGSAGMSAEQFSGSSNSTEIANQLINALNSDAKGPQVGPSAAPRPQLAGNNPVHTQSAPHTQPSPQPAPNNNSMMAPTPMSAPNAGMRPRMGGRPAVGVGRAPAQNGSSAPGLRLKTAAPGQGAVTPPICRAESLYELLNSSKAGVRPIRRAQVGMAPAQSPMPQPAQPVVTSASLTQPSYAQEAPSHQVDVQPTAPAPQFGYETTGFDSSDPMGGNPAQSNSVVVAGADAPVEQEVQDAINAILRSSSPQNGGVERPQGTEREEALKHVRMLRAQLVGLQQRLGDEPEQAQPTSNYQAPQYDNPVQPEIAGGAQDPFNQPYSGGVSPHQDTHQVFANQPSQVNEMQSAGRAGFETGHMSPTPQDYSTVGQQQAQPTQETSQSGSAFYVPAPAQEPTDVATYDPAPHAQDHFQDDGVHNAYQGQGLMGRGVTGETTGQNGFQHDGMHNAQGFSNPDFAFAPQGGAQVPAGMPAPVAPRANAHYDAAQSYVYEEPAMEQPTSHSAEQFTQGGNRIVVPYSPAASSQSNMLTHESARQPMQPQQKLSYAPEHGGQAYGDTPQFEDHYDQQAGQWSEQSPVIPAMGNEGLPTVIDETDLPRGIMPDVAGEHRGGGIGSGFKIAGGLALAASLAGVGIFYSGYPVPYKDEAVAQMRTLQSSVMAMIDPKQGATDNGSAIVDQAAVQRPIALEKAGGSGASIKAASLSALNVEGDTKEPIKLAVSMTDVVGEGNAVVRFKGVPAGATLSGGYMVADGTWLVSQDKLAETEMSVPEYYSGSFSVEAQALAEDAITVVSEQVAFDVNVGSSNVASASGSESKTPAENSFVTASDNGATVSTLSETVPTASNEAIVRPAAASEEKQVAALAAAEPADKPLDALGQLVADGNKLLEKADFVGARKLFKKAAEEGSSEAALAMGQSYDPVYFEKRKLSRSNADTEQALIWYQEALSRGNDAARTRVDDLLRWVQKGS